MTIDFEKDQTEVLDKTTNINKLADKIKELQAHQQQLEVQEDAIKQKKKDIADAKQLGITLEELYEQKELKAVA